MELNHRTALVLMGTGLFCWLVFAPAFEGTYFGGINYPALTLVAGLVLVAGGTLVSWFTSATFMANR